MKKLNESKINGKRSYYGSTKAKCYGGKTENKTNGLHFDHINDAKKLHYILSEGIEKWEKYPDTVSSIDVTVYKHKKNKEGKSQVTVTSK